VEEEVKTGVKAWAKSLRPPKASATDRQVQAWRWAIAITSGVTALSLATHIALACGLISSIHPGFALAADIEQIQRERKIERQSDLEQKILQVKKEQCTASGQAKSLYTFSLQKMLVEYQKLSGSAYPVPACEDFQ
jgi:hypothetical protein